MPVCFSTPSALVIRSWAHWAADITAVKLNHCLCLCKLARSHLRTNRAAKTNKWVWDHLHVKREYSWRWGSWSWEKLKSVRFQQMDAAGWGDKAWRGAGLNQKVNRQKSGRIKSVNLQLLHWSRLVLSCSSSSLGRFVFHLPLKRKEPP